ncbi:MAG: cytochrome C [Deltaproteobacteria bacterium]|nr:cytochrome C [Deltaproteobacteria bacterium]
MDDDSPSTPIKKGTSAQPRAIFNPMSVVGFALALFGGLGEVFIFLNNLFSGISLNYQGVVVMLFMLVIIIGLVLVGIGYWLEKKRRKSGREASFSGETLVRHPILALMFAVGLTAATAIVIGTGSYQVYHMTESVEFCGQLCHSVMNPEYTTYHNSSHARVKCVECHIGEGADWFVRAKISGMRQIYGVLANDYPKPIPTPIHNLRPARETCEKCHWPGKFIGFKEKILTYYQSDEKNTQRKLRLLVKIGGEEETALMKGSGIHFHMLSRKVEYISRSPDRQKIDYIKVTRTDNSVSEYLDTDNMITDEEIKNSERRIMDCLDCHNRPAHKFRTPMKTVNASMKQGLISTDIPQIKLQAVIALDTDYKTTPEAVTGIGNALRNFYEKNYPGFINNHPKKWLTTVEEIQAIYKRSIFPEMKAKWKVYPDNIGHRDWPGCFRCHNENTKTKEGKALYQACNDCHLILAQGEDISKSNADFVSGLPFNHPGNDEILDEYTDCNDCHDGGKTVYE